MAKKKPSEPQVSTQDRLTEVVYIIRGIDSHKQQIVDSANQQLQELENVKVQYVEKLKILQEQLQKAGYRNYFYRLRYTYVRYGVYVLLRFGT